MEEEKKLTPVKFLPDSIEAPWGNVTYMLADLGFIDSMAAGGWLGGNTISDIMQTYLERVVGDDAFECYGTQFPVLVKWLDVKGRTSLHVNPDDEAAEQRYDSFGKTALWYVAETYPDAALCIGLKRDVSAEEFYRRCNDGSVDGILNWFVPEKGRAYLIPPSRVHAARGVKLLEIAECSELCFRLHEWEETGREKHLEEAFDLIDMRGGEVEQSPSEDGWTLHTPQFTVQQIKLSAPMKSVPEKPDSFFVYVCVKGAAKVQDSSLREGEAILIPAEVEEFFLIPEQSGTILLEIHFDPRPEVDSYTGDKESWQE